MPALKKVPPLSDRQKIEYGPHEPPLVDKKIVAADLRVGTRTVERWVAERKIPFIRIGHRMLRFKLDDVRRAIARWSIKEIS
jgi:excisionase family DNA binding protein